MKHQHIIIGALVGMGPNSTAIFYNAIMNYARTLYGATYDNDFPHMVLYSLPTPFTPHQPIDDIAMKQALAIGIDALNVKELGVDYIVIPCNIAHKYYDYLSKRSTVPLLNIVEITLQKISRQSRKIALLATQSTIDCKIYQHSLQQQAQKIFHNAILQTYVNDLLKELKVHGLSLQSQTHWNVLVKYLYANHCDTVCLHGSFTVYWF